MTNADVARVFQQIADLMEIRGDDSFRVSSYRRVARALDDLTEEIADVAARGELETIKGVGKSSAEKIAQLLATGRVPLHDELCAEVPASLLEVLAIPGVGPKKVAVLWKELGVSTVPDLEAAIAGGKLVGLKGFAAKTIDSIKEGITFLKSSAGRTRLGVAWSVADTLRAAVAELPGVQRVEVAGSLRRGRETIGDIDLLCIAAAAGPVLAEFGKLPRVQRVLASGETKGSVLIEYRAGRTIQVDLRVVPAESFGAAWQYFTGSKEHNIRLRERAVKRGWTLNEYGLFDGEKRLAGEDEAGIYARFGLPWIPPELREDRGEFELKETPAGLLELEHIRGDLHMHTTASDGRATIEEMIAAARQRGYDYICITDHSQSSVIANGLKPDRLREHVKAIRAAAAKAAGIHVWAGAEVDIKPDGSLDYDDDLLAELDWVVASVHQGQGKDIAHNTQRTIAAIRNPYVNVVAHPTGRLINERDAMPLDVDAVARAAAETGTALEINASTYRLDLKDQHAALAQQRGAMLCIDTDAHAIDQFDQMRFGVITARRGGVLRQNVVNTWPAAKIREFVQKKRRTCGKSDTAKHPRRR